jgi:hypothetical protein
MIWWPVIIVVGSSIWVLFDTSFGIKKTQLRGVFNMTRIKTRWFWQFPIVILAACLLSCGGKPHPTEVALAESLEQFRADIGWETSNSIKDGESPDKCRKLIAAQLAIFKEQQNFTPIQIVQARVSAFRAVSGVAANYGMEESLNADGMVGASEKKREAIRQFTEFLKELQSDPLVQRELLLVYADSDHGTAMANWLIQQGADVNLQLWNHEKNKTGLSALMAAVIKGNEPTVKVFLKAGANPNLKGPGGMTATMFATSRASTKILKMLLDAKADLKTTDAKGNTALKFAMGNNNAEAVVLLKEAGAKN